MAVFKNVWKNGNFKKKLYKKWYFLKFFEVKNLIQIYTKTHQIAPFLKIFSGGMPPNPPNKAHGDLCIPSASDIIIVCNIFMII